MVLRQTQGQIPEKRKLWKQEQSLLQKALVSLQIILHTHTHALTAQVQWPAETTRNYLAVLKWEGSDCGQWQTDRMLEA